MKRTAIDATWFSWVSHKGRGARFSKSCWWMVEGYRTSHSLLWSPVAHSVQCGTLKLAVTSSGISLATAIRNPAWTAKQAHRKGKQAHRKGKQAWLTSPFLQSQLWFGAADVVRHRLTWCRGQFHVFCNAPHPDLTMQMHNKLPHNKASS